jgi:hypothetical protein
MDSIDFFPTSKMSFTNKIIVTVRLVIILSIIGYMITSNSAYLWMGLFTASSIGGLYYYREYVDKDNDTNGVEPFENIKTISQYDKILTSKYDKGTPANPLSNVLLTEYTDNPTRKSAPPTFNNSGIDEVNNNVKETVQELNPTIEDTSKQLFGGLYNNFELNNSNRAFFSTPNTKIPNDQGAFAQYLYGDMKSCKEDSIQCIKDNTRYNLY